MEVLRDKKDSHVESTQTIEDKLNCWQYEWKIKINNVEMGTYMSIPIFDVNKWKWVNDHPFYLYGEVVTLNKEVISLSTHRSLG